MLRRTIQVGLGSTALCVTGGIYTLYSDRPSADRTKNGTLEAVDPPKYPEVVHGAARTLVTASSVLVSKLYLGKMNNFTCSGSEKLEGAVRYRKPDQALITVSNHTSTVDDPAILACILPFNVAMHPSYVRWALCSQEYCYEKNALVASFFYAGKTLPIRRGAGIDHVFLEEFHKKVQQGQWVHIFPEGKIDQSGEMLGRGLPRSAEIGRLKWGVGKLIARADVAPLVVPVCHVGMENVMPQNKSTQKIKSFLPKINQRVHVIVGDPIDFSDLLANYTKNDTGTWASTEEERLVFSAITKRIEDAMLDLDRQAKQHLAKEATQKTQEGVLRHRHKLQQQQKQL